jgi:hypothetical protein
MVRKSIKIWFGGVIFFFVFAIGVLLVRGWMDFSRLRLSDFIALLLLLVMLAFGGIITRLGESAADEEAGFLINFIIQTIDAERII